MTFKISDFLLLEMGLDARTSAQLIRTAPERYKRYKIRKRNGGWREIAHPARELKIVQGALVRALLAELPVHEAATAYVPGTSIKLNATRHLKNGPIRKYDFKDFFPSITAKDWIAYCTNHGICSPIDAEILSRLFFTRAPRSSTLRLSIGAPSSPILSNILMFDFDARVTELSNKERITFTRYADDLTFSAERTGYLNSVDKIIRRGLAEPRVPNLRINHDKTVTATKRFRRQVTGIVLSNDKELSIGRERKRNLRAALHHLKLGKLDDEDTARLAGQLAFARDIEPEFYARMERRYGVEFLKALASTGRGYKRPGFRK